MDCLQQRAYLKEISLSPQQRQLTEAIGQVQEAGAQVVQDVPKRFAVAVNENISSVVLQHRDLPREHGPQHWVAAAGECVQGRGEDFSTDVQSHRVLKGAPVVIRWVQIEHLESGRCWRFSWSRRRKVQDPFALCRTSKERARNFKSSHCRLQGNLFPLVATNRSWVREDVRISASTAFKGEDLKQWGASRWLPISSSEPSGFPSPLLCLLLLCHECIFHRVLNTVRSQQALSATVFKYKGSRTTVTRPAC